ncbi:hypothetical protein C3747_14g337 [Trypanosoma cruzi]|uniref:Uncharacterized protein n=2 Tax=Trypanosoma cruzi TaxID=5693 RepID=Q4DHH5_TRYCC|nr:hypothetical protein, conserved [Trypanosoma cruzi]EAN91973.1 hypothetical protein, conserved [Trypanosoma cruzi]PWV18236.1 hypothetical protein C3747_14g337 [Trypanosoma cruzi]|eukprot:XP_813824.1 hypothetical protein [Trypanosoma cruzi strain CL Brener]
MLFAPGHIWRVRRFVAPFHLLHANPGVRFAAAMEIRRQQSTSAVGDDDDDDHDGKSLPSHGGTKSRRGRSRRRDARGKQEGEATKLGFHQQKENDKGSSASVVLPTILTNGKVFSSSVPAAHSEDSLAVARSLEVHRRLLSEAQLHRQMQAGETVASGAAHVAHEKIERRRKKWALTEVEFDVGITERLFPEIRRLSSLHELHYGDALMREVDAASYFASKDSGKIPEQLAANGKTVEMSLTDADFLSFEEQEPLQQPVPATSSSFSTVPSSLGESGGIPPDKEERKQQSQESVSCQLQSEEKVVVHGVRTPWFVPEGGVVRLEPLSSSDAVCLLCFVLHLRRQTLQHLPLAVQKRMKEAQALQGAASNDKKSLGRHLSLEDVMLYLDTAPPPVIGFTENLPPSKSPAFLFVLYTENVSLQNAIGHMAALFNIPQRAFHTCTAVSKMSCGAVLCAVGPNHLQREHLLLLNTMRHPGFVLRVGSVRAVEDEKSCADLFGDLSLWQPLNEVELLLRRVSCGSRHELEHRLRAVQEVGAVFFCANREASLARAATDVLHGFFKSALLNALHRRNAPMAMRHFLSRPNPITAARAKRVSTDATVRQVLKNYILVGGDWSQTVARTPYVWRRRWLSALRCSVWNMMASRRLRHGGRRVLPGDVVLRPEYRADAHRRMLTTVKAEHVMLVNNESEAAECSLEDVFIPFLRGVYPSELFAPENTQHPIMTRSNMLTLLREAHAPQLLLGMSDSCRLLLDIRSESSPLLFRRFIIRPIDITFTILEDKPPMKSIHFDAARVLENDRLRLQRLPLAGKSIEKESSQTSGDTVAKFSLASSLVSQSLVLGCTTIGARLSNGLLAEEFFTPPVREEYVALGHVERQLNGNLVLAAPRTGDDALKTIDRLFTIHVHAVVRNGLAALGHMLREYFILVGVEREDDSALQHKIHRVRRELDTETRWLTSPTFCRACYCRDHDALESCAEYQFKRGKHESFKRREEVIQELAKADTSAMLPPNATTGMTDMGSSLATVENPKDDNMVLELELRLRRRSEEQKWGIHLTSTLYLSAIDDVTVVSECRLRWGANVPYSPAIQKVFRNEMLGQNEHQKGNATKKSDGANPQFVALSQFILKAMGGTESLLRAGDDDSFLPLINTSEGLPLSQFHDVFPPPTSILTDGVATAESRLGAEDVNSRKFLRQCKWVLTGINDTAVTERRQVAAVFVKLGKRREVCLQFRATLQVFGGCGAPCLIAGEKLPETIELVLNRRGPFTGGWGLKFGSNSLALLNLSQLIHADSSSGLKIVFDPPSLPGVASTETVDGKYVLSRVNGEVVVSQRDVLERLQRKKVHGEEEFLRLQLVLCSQRGEENIGVTEGEDATVVNRLSAFGTAGKEGGEYGQIASQEGATVETDGGKSGEKEVLPACSPQCTPVTPAQRKRSVATIVINRKPEAPSGRWGIRVQRGTLRLQRIQSNHDFSFQVYAAKRQQALRIADTLRFNNLQKRDRDQYGLNAGLMEEAEAATSDVAFYSHFVYLIVGVNHRRVESIEELRASLAAAARSTEESVVLQVQQYRLAQLSVQIVRGGGDGSVALEPVGFRVSRDMVVESVEAGSPMARAILAATNDGCSLRHLINGGSSPTATAGEHGDCSVSNLSGSKSHLSTSKRWDFHLDEDMEALSELPAPVKGATTASDAGASGIITPPVYWNMVDGVKLMSMCGGNGRTRFVWRVSYGVRAGPLRTPQDVARAFAADVKEETLFLQQCLIDD